MDLPEVRGLRRLEGYVETDNLPARRCNVAAGFKLESPVPDDEGFLKYACEFEHVG